MTALNIATFVKDQSDELLNIFNCITSLVYIVKINSNTYTLSIINETAVQDSGFTVEQCLNKDIKEVLTPKEYLESEKIYKQIVQEKKALSVERILETPHGKKIYKTLYTPLFTNDICEYIFCSAIDITATRQLEQNSSETQRLYNLFAENSKDMLVIINPDNTVAYSSPSSETLLGYKPEEMIGKNSYEYMHPDDAAMIQKEGAAATDQHGIVTLTYRVRRKNGEYIWVETVSKIIMDPTTNQIKNILAISRDIDDRLKAQKALEKRAKDLEILNTAFVGRENKVVELKKRIQELEDLLKNNNIPIPADKPTL